MVPQDPPIVTSPLALGPKKNELPFAGLKIPAMNVIPPAAPEEPAGPVAPDAPATPVDPFAPVWPVAPGPIFVSGKRLRDWTGFSRS